MDLEALRLIRLAELERPLAVLERHRRPGGGKLSILEIGAGTGWQARVLSERGYDVTAVDLAGSEYKGGRVWNIVEYDGVHLPFPDGHFDIVFSSNALEHVPHLERFQLEMQRVLREDGRAIHVVPSGAWRFWTSLTHYPNIARLLLELALPRAAREPGAQGQELPHKAPWRRAVTAMFPRRHGETGNVWTELAHFSARSWRRSFLRAGWRIEETMPAGIFYTGHMLFPRALTIEARSFLSRALGSACHVFVLARNPGSRR